MKHILFDLKECLVPSLLDDEEYVKETLIEAIKIAKLELLRVDTHKFQPHGVTGYALLKESHISIHTWPEDDIASGSSIKFSFVKLIEFNQSFSSYFMFYHISIF